MELKKAITQLESDFDGHWTSDGQPRLDVLSEMTGKKVTRAEVLVLAPTLMRATAESGDALPDGAGDGPEQKAAQGSAPAAGSTQAPNVADGAKPAMDAPKAAQGGGGENDVQRMARALPLAPAGGRVVPSDLMTEAEIQRHTYQDLIASADLCDRVLRSLTYHIAIANDLRRAVEAKLSGLNMVSNTVSRISEARKRSDPNQSMSDIRAHLKSTSDARAEKHGRLQRFIDAGVSPREVGEALAVGSKLDRVLGARAGHGDRRPNFEAQE